MKYRPRSLAETEYLFKAKRTNTLRAIHTPPSILYGAHAREGGTNKRTRTSATTQDGPETSHVDTWKLSAVRYNKK